MGNEIGSIIWAVAGLAAIGLLIGGYVWLQRRQRADLRATISAIAVPASLIPGVRMSDQEAHDFYADPVNHAVTGPGQKRSAPRKTAMVAVRFDPAVIEAVKRLTDADGSGVTVSSWIREAVRREEYRQRVKWLDEHRHEMEVIPGSGRALAPRHIPSSLAKVHTRSLTVTGSPGPMFGCVHMTVANVTGVSCGQCGPLAASA